MFVRVGLLVVFLTAATVGSQPALGGERNMQGTKARVTSTAVVNLTDLAQKPVSSRQTPELRVSHPVQKMDEVTGLPVSHSMPSLTPPAQPADALAPLVASPAPVGSFEALRDSFAVGTSIWYIPPDTHGAVGLDKVMVTLNNNLCIQNKSTGATLSTVSLASFWAATGATDIYDPKVVYDPYNSRWITTALGDPVSANSAILIAVSQTSDPSGSWYLASADADDADTTWADFPCIGFNKNWIGISVNMFTVNSPYNFREGRLLTLNYPSARAGTWDGTIFVGILAGYGGFCFHPAVTYSPKEDTLFCVSHMSSSGATYILSWITGTASDPAGTIGDVKTNGLGAWTQANNSGPEVLPQAPEPSPGEGTRKIDVGDSYIRSRVVFRNGSIYYSQTIGHPAGGAVQRTGVQWTRINRSGDYQEGGRVLDPTATARNGGKWYAYSSIDVNAFNDVLLGFSQFSSAQWPSAGYTFKARGDAAGTMRDPYIFKTGQDYYEKDFSGSVNRWGDFSGTQTDPSDDYHLWTIQEYSRPRVGIGNDAGRWGTWWAKVQPVDPLPIQLASFTATRLRDDEILLEWTTATELNNYGFEVQRAVEGAGGFSTLPGGFIPGHGTTNVPQSYSYIDSDVPKADFYYRLKQIDLDGTVYYYDLAAADLPTGVPSEGEPVAFRLHQNYPNPFNPETRISFTLPSKSMVRLSVFNILGESVQELAREELGAGTHVRTFNGHNLPSGVYLCRIEAGNFRDAVRMVLVK